MEDDYPIHSSVLRGGRLLKWLVKENTVIKEDQPIAEIFAPGMTGALCSQVYRAPVNGKLIHLQSPPSPAPTTISSTHNTLSTPSSTVSSSSSVTTLSSSSTATSSSSVPLARIRYCTHSIIYGGICSICGVNMQTLPRNSLKLWEETHAKHNGTSSSSSSSSSASTRTNDSASSLASSSSLSPSSKRSRIDPSSSSFSSSQPSGMMAIRVQHGIELMVSASHIQDTNTQFQTRLHKQRKLCLVLDLDHTLVHATNDERALLATQDPIYGSQIFSWQEGPIVYRIKKRPYLHEFLTQISELYELQVDTAGTRAYANMVLHHIDPDKKLFGDRLVSRCDSSLRHKDISWGHRSINDDRMVVIVDDTTDIWKRSIRNVLTIEPYMFWHMNSTEVNNKAGRSMIDTGAHTPPQSYTPLPSNSSSSATIDNSNPSASSSTSSSSASSTSIRDPPTFTSTVTTPALYHEESHYYLQDILRMLKNIHTEYYKQYDNYVFATDSTSHSNGSSTLATVGSSGSTHTTLSSSVTSPNSSVPVLSPSLPSVPTIIESLYRQILYDCCFVFSGVFPLSENNAYENSNLYKRVLAFGAAIAENTDTTRSRVSLYAKDDIEKEGQQIIKEAEHRFPFDRTGPTGTITSSSSVSLSTTTTTTSTLNVPLLQYLSLTYSSSQAYENLSRFNQGIVTHVIARSGGTAKTRAAVSDPSIRIVPLAWLEQCILQYRRLPEAEFSPYLPGYDKFHSREQSQRVEHLRTLRQLSHAEAITRYINDYVQNQYYTHSHHGPSSSEAGSTTDEEDTHHPPEEEEDHHHHHHHHPSSSSHGGKDSDKTGYNSSLSSLLRNPHPADDYHRHQQEDTHLYTNADDEDDDNESFAAEFDTMFGEAPSSNGDDHDQHDDNHGDQNDEENDSN